jgi:FAD/FMN-containing dehydrogenase
LPIWENWSGSIRNYVDRILTPTQLHELRNIVADPQTNEDGFIHAEGSRWAFSAPAYCQDIMIDTTSFRRFPSYLQAAVVPSEDPKKFRIAVEAGMKIRQLYSALADRDPAPLPRGDPFNPPTAFLPPGEWTLPTLGGAGGQSIAGAISTGTHGGDVARPPLSDAVLAMLMIGSNGELRLLQHPPSRDRPPVVNVSRLETELRPLLGEPVVVRDVQNSDALRAAVVSLGRFGIVIAYVLEIVDEAGKRLVEERKRSTWNVERQNLHMKVQDAVAADESAFLQIIINPYKREDNDRTCFVTTRSLKELDSVRGVLDVTTVRQQTPYLGTIMQQLCEGTIPHWLEVALQAVPLLSPELALVFHDVIRPLYQVGDPQHPDYLLGDAIADMLTAAQWRLPKIVEIITGIMIARDQADTITVERPGMDDDVVPWKVKGNRFEITDIHDYYQENCYRGDSIEIFFEVDKDLSAKIDHVLEVFNDLSERKLAIGAYVSLRFMAKTQALLGLARWNPTCSVEISILRGLQGNSEALRLLKEVALKNNGFVHWGQQNDLTRGEVEKQFGAALKKWRIQLDALESVSMLFSTPFTREHGLEVPLVPDWTRWEPLGLSAQSSPSVVSAGGNNQPLEIFSKNSEGITLSRKRRVDGAPDSDWTPVHDDVVEGSPVAFRNNDGRIELFVLDEERMKHRWEDRPGGQWSSWDILGASSTEARIKSAPTVTAHRSGRLEVFARGDLHRGATMREVLFHTWQWDVIPGRPWYDVIVRGHEPMVSRPSSCLREFNGSDQIVVVALSAGLGNVYEKHQVGPGGNTGWTDWLPIVPLSGPWPHIGGGSPIAVAVGGIGATVHVFVIDIRGQVYETLEEARTLDLSWGQWQALPPTAAVGRLDPACRLTTVQTDRLYLFGKSLLGGRVVVCEFRPGVGWSNWQDLGGEFSGDVAAGAHADGRVEVVVRGASDNQLMARRQSSPSVW